MRLRRIGGKQREKTRMGIKNKCQRAEKVEITEGDIKMMEQCVWAHILPTNTSHNLPN